MEVQEFMMEVDGKLVGHSGYHIREQLKLAVSNG
jgi:hypothetical protein